MLTWRPFAWPQCGHCATLYQCYYCAYLSLESSIACPPYAHSWPGAREGGHTEGRGRGPPAPPPRAGAAAGAPALPTLSTDHTRTGWTAYSTRYEANRPVPDSKHPSAIPRPSAPLPRWHLRRRRPAAAPQPVGARGLGLQRLVKRSRVAAWAHGVATAMAAEFDRVRRTSTAFRATAISSAVWPSE